MKKLFIFMFFALSMNSHASITQKNLENFFKFISPAIQNVAIMKIDFTRPTPYRIEGEYFPRGGRPTKCVIEVVGDADNQKKVMKFRMVTNTCK
jgi:hypothetical protein